MASLSSYRAKPQETLSEGLMAVPTSLTLVPGSVSGKDVVIYQVLVSNPTAGALTYLLQDIQSSPLALIPTVSVAANTAYVIAFPEGIRMVNGAKQQASGPGLVAEVFGSTHA